MLRITLTNLSLLGLSLSLGLWVANYLMLPFVGRGHYAEQLMAVGISMWMPPATFALLLVFCLSPIPFRRSKSKKLGLCVKCGYDLRGSKERCPECGLSLEKRNTKGESTCEQEC